MNPLRSGECPNPERNAGRDMVIGKGKESIRMKKGFVWLGLFVAVSIWGSLYVASKFLLAQVSPFILRFLRLAIASAWTNHCQNR